MARTFTAIGTPLTDTDDLHEEGLRLQLEDQHAAGVEGLLVGGSMGLCQMLTRSTWQRLVEESLALGAGRFELLVGVGDTSFARTCERIEWCNQHRGIDGVVVLTPYLWKVNDRELADYYSALADAARMPVFLYDLPQLTGIALPTEVVMAAAQHPNIAGIKCSGNYELTKRWIEMIDPGFRFIVAQPDQIDQLIRDGVAEHLDGIYSIAPQWVKGIEAAVHRGDHQEAADMQRILSAARDKMLEAGVWASFTAVMNARGIPGRFAPRPFRMLDEDQRRELLAYEPIAQLLGTCPILGTVVDSPHRV